MNFTTDEFLLFLPVVFALYWAVSPSARRQNIVLLAASYTFYGWWDYRFLGLIILSSVCDFWVAKKIASSDCSKRRLRLLYVSLFANLGVLGAFKYFDFFLDSLVALLVSVGYRANTPSLELILPIGISFYTFQTMGYAIDVYRRRVNPSKDWIEFFTFVAFFPQLVAGPIERASSLLQQFKSVREFDYVVASSGFRLILWGFFKKLVVADNCAPLVDLTWRNSEVGGYIVWLAFVLFSFQIYADFSGYSDIAIGTARLFGVRLSCNFQRPYFADGLRDFWQRWHITLSNWFRDYLYIPLGGNRKNHVRNILVTFALSGFWHGANWTFLVWGSLHGVCYLAHSGRLTRPLTFLLVTALWIPFRAPSLPSAGHFLMRGFQPTKVELPTTDHLFCALVGIAVLLLAEFLQPEQDDTPVTRLARWPLWQRWATYCTILPAIYVLGNFGGSYDFIYFQF